MPDRTNRRSEPEEWTTKAFLDHFLMVEKQMEERKFAFILGAGASITSGVPSGLQLVNRWLAELHARPPADHRPPVEEWATAETLDIEGFKYKKRAEFYPQIYDRRFRDDLGEGYAYLEEVMKKAHPGLGYSMLAQILDKTRHKVVITTNFDNLVADAVLLFTDTFAQTCGHESLTGYVGVQPRRPLIAKIHRDLLLGPQNDPYETDFLHENWAGTLRRIFTTHTPLIIGYGGNDGSLMNFLYSLKPGTIPGTLFWIYRGEKPNERIRRLVVRQSGKLVPIIDFDVFMTQLAQRLDFGLLDVEIEKRAGKWAQVLRDEWKRVRKATDVAPARADDEAAKEASEQVRETFDKVETQRTREREDWWSWELTAQREDDPEKREAIYRQALETIPNSPELIGIFAAFLTDVRKDYDESERLYQRALDLDPENAVITGNLALFLHGVRKDYDKAERLYRHALDLDSDRASNTGNFALFLHEVRKEYDEAERLYRRALELDPEYANNAGNFAFFVHEICKDYDEAERLYRRAMELDPDHANNAGNFAGFLLGRRRYDEAQAMSDRAWILDNSQPSSRLADLTLCRAGLLLSAGDADAPALGRLKTMFQTGFLRHVRWFGDLLCVEHSWLSEEDQVLYRALADAILDEEKVAALDAFERWTEVEAIPLDEPWENIGD